MQMSSDSRYELDFVSVATSVWVFVWYEITSIITWVAREFLVARHTARLHVTQVPHVRGSARSARLRGNATSIAPPVLVHFVMTKRLSHWTTSYRRRVAFLVSS
jgi:hypothetical protein